MSNNSVHVDYNGAGEFFARVYASHRPYNFRSWSLAHLKNEIKRTFSTSELTFSLSHSARQACAPSAALIGRAGLRTYGETQTRRAPADMQTRRAPTSVTPGSYSRDDRSVDATLSVGAAVRREYGVEKLEISTGAIDLTRVRSGGIPVLDSHQVEGLGNLLGRIDEVWVDGKALVGRVRFNDTPEGRKAEGMVARGELKHLSIGYRVDEWSITDAEGREINPEYVRWDDSSLTFTGKRWELLEASLVTVPADYMAAVRSL